MRTAGARWASRAALLVAALLGTAVGLAALVVAALAFVPPVRQAVLRRALHAARAALPGEIEIGRASWTSLGTIALENVLWVDPPDTLLHADRLAASIELLPLVQGDLHLDGLTARGLSANVPEIRARLPAARAGRARAGSSRRRSFLRSGSVFGAPSVGVDRLDIDAPRLVAAPGTEVERFRLDGSLDLLHGHRPVVAVDSLSFGAPAQGIEMDEVSMKLDLAGEGNLQASGRGRLAPEWPFVLDARTEDDGAWRFSLARAGGTPAEAHQGIEADGRFGRKNGKIEEVSFRANIQTPDARTLSRFPALSPALSGLPALDGLDARAEGRVFFRNGTEGALILDIQPNDWISSGFASVRFEPEQVSVDSLSLGFFDLDVNGHWRIAKGVEDGRIVARARGTRWMRSWLASADIPDSLALDLDARLSGPTNDLGIAVRLAGGVRRGSMRVRDVALAAEGTTAAGHGVRFAAVGTTAGLDVSASGVLVRDSAISVRLNPLLVRSADRTRRRPAASVPASGSVPSAQSPPTILLDPQSGRLRVQDLAISGDFGRATLSGTFAKSGGTFRAVVAWPQAPEALMSRLQDGAARDELARRWSQGRAFGAVAEARIAQADSGAITRVEGNVTLPGPAVFAPLMPESLDVHDLGDIEGSFLFTAAGVRWNLAADLGRTAWIDTFNLRAHQQGTAAILDTLEARMLGLTAEARGRVDGEALEGRVHVRVADARLLSRFGASGTPPRMHVDLEATIGGTAKAPTVAASFSGGLERASLSVPRIEGEVHTSGRTLESAVVRAPEGVDLASVSFDSARVVFQPEGGTQGGLSVRERFAADGSELTIRQAGRLVEEPGGWTLTGDTLHVAAGRLALDASRAYILRTGRGRLSLQGLDLRGSLGTVTAEFTRQGAAADLAAAADLHLPKTRPSWAAIPAGLWPTSVQVRLRQTLGDSVDAEVTADGLQIGPRARTRATLDLHNGTHRTRVDARLENADGVYAEAVGIVPGNFRLFPPTPIALDGPLAFDVAFDRFPLPEQGGNPVTIPGYLDGSGTNRSPLLTARGTLRGTSVAPAATLEGTVTFPAYPELASYTVSARAALVPPGVATAAPDEAAPIALSSEIPTTFPGRPDTLHLPSSKPGLAASLRALDGSRPVLSASIVYPIELSFGAGGARTIPERSLDASLDVRDLAVGDVKPFIPQVLRLGGTADLHLSAQGDPSDPAIDGQGKITGVEVELKTGTHAAGSGQFSLSGHAKSPVVNGKVSIENGTILIPEQKKEALPVEGNALLWQGEKSVAAKPPTLTSVRGSAPADSAVRSQAEAVENTVPLDTLTAARAAQSAATISGPLAAATVNVQIEVPNGVVLTGHGLEVQLTGDLKMSQRSGQIVLLGTLTAQQGRMDFHGRRLDIEHGEIIFYGTEKLNPSLDLLLVKNVQNVTINVHITGTLDQPRLDLTSTPEMSEADIFSYLLFDKPVGGLEGGQQTALEDRARATAQEFATGQLTARLSRELNIDLLSVQYGQSDTTATSLTVGKYITPRLLVKYQQEIEQGRAYAVVLQYWLRGGFKLEIHTSRYAQSGGVLTWTRDY